MSEKPRCYVASPLGFSEAGRYYYEDVLLPALSKVVEVVDPWVLTAQEEFDEARRSGQLGELVKVAGKRNQQALETCEFLVAVLDGQEVDSGTAAEIGYAAASGVKCFGLRTDTRDSGEPGARVNLQVQSFLATSGGLIADNLESLLKSLATAIDQGPPQPISA
jgi:nucleoside 2-deoxyribosyltransferase